MDILTRLQPLIGLVGILGVAYSLSTNRKAISLRVVGWGLGLQVLFALIVAVGAFLAFMLFGVLAPKLPLKRLLWWGTMMRVHRS